MKNKKIIKISLLQSTALISYIGLVSIIFWKGNEIFGKMDNYLGPLMVLTLFAISALSCSLIVFGYPFILFFNKDKKHEAVKIVLTTAALTFGYLLIFMFLALLT